MSPELLHNVTRVTTHRSGPWPPVGLLSAFVRAHVGGMVPRPGFLTILVPTPGFGKLELLLHFY